MQNFRNKFKGLYNPDTTATPQTQLGTPTPDVISELQHEMPSPDDTTVNNEELETAISQLDVIEALHRAKNGKALGFDQIPVEVLHNETAIRYLDHLFSKCFETGLAPKLWSKGVISPIPKCNTSDPLSNRGITLASSVYYKLC